MALLLDGLDEVQMERQNSCVQAINQFRQGYGLAAIAICCRIAAYERLSERLQLSTAISLRALSAEQISTAVADDSRLRTVLAEDNAVAYAGTVAVDADDFACYLPTG